MHCSEVLAQLWLNRGREVANCATEYPIRPAPTWERTHANRNGLAFGHIALWHDWRMCATWKDLHESSRDIQEVYKGDDVESTATKQTTVSSLPWTVEPPDSHTLILAIGKRESFVDCTWNLLSLRKSFFHCRCQICLSAVIRFSWPKNANRAH